jgi:hypothetical protein
LAGVKVKRKIRNNRWTSGSDYFFLTFDLDERERPPDELRDTERTERLRLPEKLREEDILPLENDDRLEDDLTREDFLEGDMYELRGKE